LNEDNAEDWVVLGHHGTTADQADAIVATGFKIKKNRYDWLGHGVYFFERAPRRALAWAEDNLSEAEACVVAANIALSDHCLDLGELDGTATLEGFFEEYQETYGEEHVGTLKETFGNRELSCAVINWCCNRMSESGWEIHALRAPFEEGEPLFVHPTGSPTVRLKKMSHVQIAVRDCSLILKTWRENKLATKG